MENSSITNSTPDPVTSDNETSPKSACTELATDGTPNSMGLTKKQRRKRKQIATKVARATSASSSHIRCPTCNQMWPKNRVCGFFPVPEPSDEFYVPGLLIRQNQNLNVRNWSVRRIQKIPSKNPEQPLAGRGRGFFVVFEIDEPSLAILEEIGYKVFFGLGTVVMKRYGIKPVRMPTAAEVSIFDRFLYFLLCNHI